MFLLQDSLNPLQLQASHSWAASFHCLHGCSFWQKCLSRQCPHSPSRTGNRSDPFEQGQRRRRIHNAPLLDRQGWMRCKSWRRDLCDPSRNGGKRHRIHSAPLLDRQGLRYSLSRGRNRRHSSRSEEKQQMVHVHSALFLSRWRSGECVLSCSGHLRHATPHTETSVFFSPSTHWTSTKLRTRLRLNVRTWLSKAYRQRLATTTSFGPNTVASPLLFPRPANGINELRRRSFFARTYTGREGLPRTNQ